MSDVTHRLSGAGVQQQRLSNGGRLSSEGSQPPQRVSDIGMDARGLQSPLASPHPMAAGAAVGMVRVPVSGVGTGGRVPVSGGVGFLPYHLPAAPSPLLHGAPPPPHSAALPHHPPAMSPVISHAASLAQHAAQLHFTHAQLAAVAAQPSPSAAAAPPPLAPHPDQALLQQHHARTMSAGDPFNTSRHFAPGQGGGGHPPSSLV